MILATLSSCALQMGMAKWAEALVENAMANAAQQAEEEPPENLGCG